MKLVSTAAGSKPLSKANLSPERILEAIGTIDLAVERAVDFIIDSKIIFESREGWPLYVGAKDIAHWGGTLDAVRALAQFGHQHATNTSVLAISDLIRSQNKDGGWGSWEIPDSNVETTCWVVLTLYRSGQSNTDAFKRGLDYIRATKDPKDFSWGAYLGAEARIYPTLLAAWALSLVDHGYSHLILREMLTKRNDDGGLGFRVGTPSVISITCLFVIVCDAARFNLARIMYDPLLQLAISKGNASKWRGEVEDWICGRDQASGRFLPTNTKHLPLFWTCVALCRPGSPTLTFSTIEVGFAVLSTQRLDGSWTFSDEDPKSYIWCTASGVIALGWFRTWLSSSIGQGALIKLLMASISSELTTSTPLMQRIDRRIAQLQSIVFILIIFSLMILSIVLWHYIPFADVQTGLHSLSTEIIEFYSINILTPLTSWLAGDASTKGTGVMVNLISSGLFVLMTALLIFSKKATRRFFDVILSMAKNAASRLFPRKFRN